MAVAQTVTWEVPPANVPEFIAMTDSVREILIGLGATDVRGFQVRTGIGTGSILTVIEFEDHTALGKYLDESATNAEFQAMVAKARGLATGVVVGILTEINPH